MHDNILIWENSRGKNLLRIYDSSMQLVASVKERLLPWNSRLYQVNCINLADSFYVIIQYATTRYFYCIAATFNERGNLLHQPILLDREKNEATSLPIIKVFRFMTSPGKSQFCLIRYTNNATNKEWECNCISFDKKMSIHRVSFSIPAEDNGAEYTAFVLDDYQNIVFATYKSELTDEQLVTKITVKKISTPDQDISSVTDIVPDRILYNMSIGINKNTHHYNLIGVYSDSADIDSDNKVKARGIFVTRLSDSLTSVTEAYFPFNSIPGLSGDSKFEKASSTPGIHYADHGAYYATAHSYVSKTDSSLLYQNGWADTSPLFLVLNQNRFKRTNPARTGMPGSVNNISIANAGLIILFFDRNDLLRWSHALSNEARGQLWPAVGSAALIHSNDLLRIIYPNTDFLTYRQNKLLSYIEVSNTGKVIYTSYLFNNSPYEIETSKGVQIDEDEIVFPCIARHGRLAFIKIAFE